MKNTDVKVGNVYRANVSGRRVVVRIDSEHPRKGWMGTNLATGREIRILSGQRLTDQRANYLPAEDRDKSIAVYISNHRCS